MPAKRVDALRLCSPDGQKSFDDCLPKRSIDPNSTRPDTPKCEEVVDFASEEFKNSGCSAKDSFSSLGDREEATSGENPQ